MLQFVRMYELKVIPILIKKIIEKEENLFFSSFYLYNVYYNIQKYTTLYNIFDIILLMIL